jgi:hypothetical protein
VLGHFVGKKGKKDSELVALIEGKDGELKGKLFLE